MFRNLKLRVACCALCAIGICAFICRPYWGIAANAVAQKFSPKKTVADRLRQYSAPVQKRLAPRFAKAGITYPPAELTLLAFKQERLLEVYAADKKMGGFKFVRAYPILGASGDIGPKLREGDGQVPEGLYAINFLNPNSLYHLSLRVSYPNDFDRAQAKQDGRQQLGGDIMIHGSIASIGCLAMGDEAAEDLFVLAALTGKENVRVVISRVDFRSVRLNTFPRNAPLWTSSLYGQIQNELTRYRQSTIHRNTMYHIIPDRIPISSGSPLAVLATNPLEGERCSTT